MHTNTAVKLFCVFFSMLITLAAISAAPYSDYDNNVHDLYEILMQREILDDPLGMHQIERRARGPQLRLRFGKRAGPYDRKLIKPEQATNQRPPSLRLRFGKRSEDNPISGYFADIPSEGEN